MNNFLKETIRKVNFFRYFLRAAAPVDIDFAIAQVIEGAKLGHYDKSILKPSIQRNYRTMFHEVQNGLGITMPGSKGLERKSGKLWLYGGKKKNRNVGFLFVTEKNQGSGEKDIEILMAGICTKFRNRGNGTNMIKKFLLYCPKGTKLYARCYAPSEGMYKILTEAGFSTINIKPSGTRELEKRT